MNYLFDIFQFRQYVGMTKQRKLMDCTFIIVGNSRQQPVLRLGCLFFAKSFQAEDMDTRTIISISGCTTKIFLNPGHLLCKFIRMPKMQSPPCTVLIFLFGAYLKKLRLEIFHPNKIWKQFVFPKKSCNQPLLGNKSYNQVTIEKSVKINRFSIATKSGKPVIVSS